MSTGATELYAFVFRGLLAEEALDRNGRVNRRLRGMSDAEVAQLLSIDLLDDVQVATARTNAIAYVAIAAFENSVRSLVTKTMVERYKEEWWQRGVAAGIRDRAAKRMEDERTAKWHSQRGQDPINYTTFGDLKSIMQNNWDAFEDLIGTLEWVAGIFDVIERSRNVIMHSGNLEPEDIARLGVNIRDWVKQAGA